METQRDIDARPTLPVSEGSLWDQAGQECDQIASQIDAEFRNRGITAWVRKSKPGEYPLYVVVESWVKVSESDLAVTFDKSSLKITISVEPYLQSPLIYKIDLDRQGRKLAGEYWALLSGEVEEMVRYLLDGGSKPAFFKPRVSLLERLIGSFLPFVGEAPQNKLIHEARPNYWTLPVFLTCGGIVLGIIAFASVNGLLGVLGLGAMVAAAIISYRRPRVEAIPKQSIRTPRREFRVDSWHVSVPGAGEQFEQFRERIYAAISGGNSEVERNIELHQNLTPTGFEERERLVLSKGQATLHVHVYPFSKDAFVGWESYINWNRWVESGPVSTTVKDDRRVAYRSLDVGVHVPTDFDLIEAEVLSETTHRLLVDEVKLFLKEREIEADLDFKIIRGDRANALKEGKNE